MDAIVKYHCGEEKNVDIVTLEAIRYFYTMSASVVN